MKSIVLFFMMLTSTLFAGSADAQIKGKSGTGRTALELSVGDISGLVRGFKFTIDGESYSLTEKEIEFDSVVYDRKNKIYVVACRGGGKELKFWIVPASWKVTRGDYGAEFWEFRARVIATDPRKEKRGSLAPEIELFCRLNYSV